MAYYSISTNEMTKSGIIDVSNFDEFDSPYNFLTLSQSTYRHSNAPFSLFFTNYIADDENPFRLTALSPDFYMSTILSRPEFEKKVLGTPMHQQNTYELIYVLKGELYKRIENIRHKYTADSCTLINRNIRHTEEYLSDFYIVEISLDYDFLVSLIQNGEDNFFQVEKKHTHTDLSQFIRDEFESDEYSRKNYIDFMPQPNTQNVNLSIYSVIDEISNLILNPTVGTSLMIKALIYRILYFLNTKDYYITDSISLGTPAESKTFSEITRLMEQTDGRISRAELSTQLNYSGNYINRIVQKYTGMSIFQYGNSFVMKKAAWMLKNTDQTVSSIIETLGFSDRTHFYKLFFNEYHLTPKQYRKHFGD